LIDNSAAFAGGEAAKTLDKALKED